jgi:hypothetical protein
MKSVLISIDYVKNQNGDLIPVEINTNTVASIRIGHENTIENFNETYDSFFDHLNFYNYLVSQNINKITTIVSRSQDDIYIKLFCEFYNFEYEQIITSGNPSIIPDIDEDDNTLLIRIAYDSLAILDELYASDELQFNQLISSESFANPSAFASYNEFDTITNLEPSIEPLWPNYLIKSRYPKSVGEYPILYNIDSEERLNEIKMSLNENEYLTKFIINSGSLSDSEARISFYRGMYLIIGSELEVLNIINYREYNSVSIDNTLLRGSGYYEPDGDWIETSPILEGGLIERLHGSKFYPSYKFIKKSSYHFDENDKILLSSDLLISPNIIFEDSSSIELKSIDYHLYDKFGYNETIYDLNNYHLTSSFVGNIQAKTGPSVFINLKVEHPEYGEFSWYDGDTTPYLSRHSGSADIKLSPISNNQIGDTIFAYDVENAIHIPLTVTDIYYDMKDMNTYVMSLRGSPLFFVQITNDNYTDENSKLFLVQHNNCNPVLCAQSQVASCISTCADCSKSASTGGGCIDCSGFIFTTCSR